MARGRDTRADEHTVALRLDKWLWQARLYRTRGLAAEAVEGGHVRIDGQRTLKPGRGVRPGATLTLQHAGRVRLIRVLDLGERRGPASEAATLYRDLDAAPEGQAPALE